MTDNRYKSDESSDEGQISDSEGVAGPSQPKKDGGQMWSELIQAEKLEEGIKTITSFNDSNGTNSKKFDRGAESFQITSFADFEGEDNTQGQEEQRPIQSNHLFSDSNCQAEEFGVRSTTRPDGRVIHERSDKKDKRGWQRFRQNKSRPQQNYSEESTLPSNRKRRMNDAISMESLNSVESESSATSFGTKPNKKKRKHKHQDNAIIRSDFSFDNLYKSTIPTGLSVDETGEKIAEELGERDTTPIKFAVSTIGVEQALKLFNDTIQTEKNGGLKVKFGSRRRTPGGVFFELLRNSSQLSDETKKQIYEFSKNYFNEKKKAV